jgi:hypothetical protein
MKKLLFILAIIAMTTPMMAQTVDFVVTDLGDGQVQIGYTNNGVPAADLPVGIALKVECTGCEVSGLVSYDQAEFPAYIDYAYTEETSGDGYDPLGEGQPLAKEENAPGRLDLAADLPATTVYVCMGRVQDGVAGPNPGPGTVVNLVTLQLADTTESGDGLVSVSEDLSSRGGVVGGGDPFATNLPVENVEIIFTTICYPACKPDYQTFLDVGSPDCWCFPRQCHGDADNQLEGLAKKWAVGALDVGIMVSAWKIVEPALPATILDSTQICADFDHQVEGLAKKWRVGALDVGIMVANWKVVDPGVPSDCLDCP